METEEKAKKYDEALEWMRKLYPGLHGATKEDAEHYFPELIKDEDERMRKSIIDVIQRAGFISSEYKYKAIAYLEKQKDIKFSVHGLYCYDARKMRQIIALLSASKEKCMASFAKDIDECVAYLEKQKKQKHAEWSEDIIRKGIKEVGLTQYQIKWLKNNVFPPKKEQKPAEYLSKEKVFAIMNKLTSLSFCVPLGSDEEKKIHEITCDVSSLLDYPIEQKQEQKPADVIDPFSNDNFVRGYESGYADAKREQKPRKFKLGDKIHWHDDDTNVITITGFRNDAYLTDSAYGPILFCAEDNWERIEQKPEIKLTGWVARDFDGKLSFTDQKPERDMEDLFWFNPRGEYTLYLKREWFLDLSWKDEPIEVEVAIRIKRK